MLGAKVVTRRFGISKTREMIVDLDKFTSWAEYYDEILFVHYSFDVYTEENVRTAIVIVIVLP